MSNKKAKVAVSPRDLVRRALAVCERCTGLPKLLSQDIYLSFEKNAYGIFGKENRKVLAEVIDQLTEAKWATGFSRKEVEKRLLNQLLETLGADGEFTEKEAIAFCERFRREPFIKFRVGSDIEGVTMASAEPLKFGDFLVYDLAKHRDLVVPRFAELDLPEDLANEGLMIECTVTAKDLEKAGELAEVLFYRFELLIHFMYGLRSKTLGVSVMSAKRGRHRKSYVLWNDRFTLRQDNEHPYRQIPIDDAHFMAPDGAFARLRKIAANPISDMDKKIVRGVEWLGQALTEVNRSAAFVNAATALEVMLKYDDRGLVNAGIAASFSECCALILGQSLDERLFIYSEAKRLYGERSKIVHSGSAAVSVIDLNTIIHIGCSMVISLLEDPAFSSASTPKELHQAIARRKFAGPFSADVIADVQPAAHAGPSS